ncbi:MAG: hypothetical protein PHT69_08190 [Bacteroidales bacterium]|nr:hypothetical protein [Bacteroidales bacterium]
MILVKNNTSIELNDGIIHYKCTEEQVDCTYLNSCINKKLDLVENNSYPVFADFTRTSFINREARDRLMGNESLKGVSAVAVLIETKVQYIIYKYIMMFYKPPVTINVFWKKQKAIEWLQDFKIK